MQNPKIVASLQQGDKSAERGSEKIRPAVVANLKMCQLEENPKQEGGSAFFGVSARPPVPLSLTNVLPKARKSFTPDHVSLTSVS